MGNHHPNAAPRNVYAAEDGYVALSASSPSMFENLANTIGHPELVEDARFATNAARVEHADELDEYIAAWITCRTVEGAIDELEAGDAVVAPVYDMSDVFEDEQFATRGDIVRVPDGDVGPTRTHGIVPKFSRTEGEVRHLGPRHGEHNEAVFVEELGLPRAEFERLEEAGVL
jgi:formyl-CoA transferase